MDRVPRPRSEAVLYAGSAAIALLVVRYDSIPLMRDWGRVAAWTYAAGALLAAGLFVWGRWSARARVMLAAAVIVGAALAPMALQVAARQAEGRRFHAQSELLIVEESARVLVAGDNPYAVSFDSGPLATWPPGTRSHVPYMPGSFAFGVPSTLLDGWPGDGRVWLALAAAAALAAGLRRLGAEPSRAALACAVLVALPLGARSMTGGGADVTVLALMLLSLVLARDRRPAAAGLAIGAAVAIKQLAWPLLPFLIVVARDGSGRPARGRMVASASAVALPLVLPFVAWDLGAFVEDVVRFPLGLGDLPTQAGEATLGSWLSSGLGLSRVWVAVLLGLAVGAAGVAMLLRRPIRTAAGAAERAGLLTLLAVVLATAGRPGYLAYPLNLLVWSRLLLGERVGLSSGGERGDAVADGDLGGPTGLDPGTGLRPPGADRRPPVRRRRLPAPLR